MSAQGETELLYGLADELGIDADRFRVAQDASTENLYLTGIEFALGVAAVAATKFLKGYLKGLRARANEREMDPAKLGERAGRWSADQIADRIDALGARADKMLALMPDQVQEEAPAIEAEIRSLLIEARAAGAAPEAEEGGRVAVVELLVANGFEPDRADALATRMVEIVAAAADHQV